MRFKRIILGFGIVTIGFLIWVFTFGHFTKKSLVVKTEQGYIQGIDENGISVFKGVPYAEPPIGALRFKAPQPHKNWGDTLQANEFGNEAIQASNITKKISGSEDCLFLNVYTPNIKSNSNKLPVMVYFPGGGMVSGRGQSYNGHSFSDRDSIVTVTINYRVGLWGFLYLADLGKEYSSSGNNGLLDCIMALRWVKKNIAAFGGDPNRVTIMGESAGAKLTSTVLVTPKAKGLFQQYISESGGVQTSRDIMTAKNRRALILNQLGVKENELSKLLTISNDSLLKAQNAVCDGALGLMFFGPVIDGVTLLQAPYSYITEGKIDNIRCLIGNNKTEATTFLAISKDLRKPDRRVFDNLFGDNGELVLKAYDDKLKNSDATSAAVSVLTNYLYTMHSFRLANLLADKKLPVYLYRFDYAEGPLGAGHAMELPYVWYDQLTDKEPINEQGLEIFRVIAKGGGPLAKIMHQSWVTFIKTGDPNFEGLPKWEPYSRDKKNAVIFDKNVRGIIFDKVFDDKNFPESALIYKK